LLYQFTRSHNLPSVPKTHLKYCFLLTIGEFSWHILFTFLIKIKKNTSKYQSTRSHNLPFLPKTHPRSVCTIGDISWLGWKFLCVKLAAMGLTTYQAREISGDLRVKLAASHRLVSTTDPLEMLRYLVSILISISILLSNYWPWLEPSSNRHHPLLRDKW